MLKLKDYSKIYQFKGLKPKNKGHMNFYECCDLTEKVYLTYIVVHCNVYNTRCILQLFVTEAWVYEMNMLNTIINFKYSHINTILIVIN